MARDHRGDGPRNAPGPQCACCGQPYAEDIGGDPIQTVPFGGFVSLNPAIAPGLHGAGPTWPAQDWFFDIRPGHTPENSDHAALAADVLEEWLHAQVVDQAACNPRPAPEATAQAIVRLLRGA